MEGSKEGRVALGSVQRQVFRTVKEPIAMVADLGMVSLEKATPYYHQPAVSKRKYVRMRGYAAIV